MNASPITSQVLRLGALGGIMKSGILNVASLIYLLASDVLEIQLMLNVTTIFGATVLITLALGHEALGQSKFRNCRNKINEGHAN